MDHLASLFLTVLQGTVLSRPTPTPATAPTSAIAVPAIAQPSAPIVMSTDKKPKDTFTKDTRVKRLRTEKKTGETRCRAILERLTGFKWPSVRPEFLKKLGTTNRALELDMYCKELGPKGVALEYQGIQHTKYQSFFGTYDEFLKGQENDRLKASMCRAHGVKLIIVHYYEFEKLNQDDPKVLETFLLQKLGEVLR